MCNCSKSLTMTDCQRLRDFNNDPLKRFFIYHIFDDEKGLKIRHVPKDSNPNTIALENGFLDENGNPQWFRTNEHPCLYEQH